MRHQVDGLEVDWELRDYGSDRERSVWFLALGETTERALQHHTEQ